MPLIKGKQLQDQSIDLRKLSDFDEGTNTIILTSELKYDVSVTPVVGPESLITRTYFENNGSFTAKFDNSSGNYGIEYNSGFQYSGQITLTNGSSNIVGVGTEFTDSTESGLDYWYELSVLDSNGDLWFCYINNITDNFNADSTSWYYKSFAYGNFSVYQGPTGTYDFYLKKSVAMGAGISIGQSSFAGQYNFVIGENSYADGYNSFAIGPNSAAAGSQSNAIGSGAYAFGGSIAVGDATAWAGGISLGDGSFAVNKSVSLGISNSYGDNSFTSGFNAKTGRSDQATVVTLGATFSDPDTYSIPGDVTNWYIPGERFTIYDIEDGGINERLYDTSVEIITSVYNSGSGTTEISCNGGVSGTGTTFRTAPQKVGYASVSLGFGQGINNAQASVQGRYSYLLSTNDSGVGGQPNGLDSDYSTIIGGRNNYLAPTINYSALIAVESMIGANAPDQSHTVYLPKVRIGQGSNAAIGTGTTEDLLAIDGTTGEIKSIPQSSVSITLNDGIGTVFNTGNSAYDLGGEITSTGQFDVYFKSNADNADSFRTYMYNNSGDSSQIIQGLDFVDIRSDSSTGTGRIILDNVGLGSVLLTVNNTFNFDFDPDQNGIKADIGAITNSRGIFYTGFGEAGNADATGANYSSLVSTSLVPKKYVDDLIAIATPYEGATVQTTNGTLTPLATIPITINTFKGFELHITATQSDLSNTKYMRVEGAIKNAAGTTAIVGSPTVFTIAQDAAAAAWEVAVSANDINDELVIEVTGETATTIDWKIDTRLI